MATGKKYMKTFNNTLLHKLEDVVNEYVESID